MTRKNERAEDRHKQLSIVTMPDVGYVIYEGTRSLAAFHYMREALDWVEGNLLYADKPRDPYVDYYAGLR